MQSSLGSQPRDRRSSSRGDIGREGRSPGGGPFTRSAFLVEADDCVGSITGRNGQPHQPPMPCVTSTRAPPDLGKQVTIRVMDKDRYGLTVAVVILPDGRNLNREMIEQALHGGIGTTHRKITKCVRKFSP